MEKKVADRTIRLERRDILKAMTTMPAAVLMSAIPLASDTSSSTPQQPADGYGPPSKHPKALNPHEWKTIHILSDLIIPADQRSGSATQARVPEFIDDWLDLKRGDLLPEIRGGLTWLDLESNRSFGCDFADCSTAWQEQILDRIAYPQRAAPQYTAAAAFFSQLRDLVVSGFFTSQMGIRDLPYLGNEPQSVWKGCPRPVLASLGIGKDELAK